MKNTSITVMLVATFLAGAFVASPELRVYAANTIRSIDIVDGQVKTADLANNAVTAAKIKDGEVKAAEIAADSVGGSELQGVTKLLFGKCSTADINDVTFGTQGSLTVICLVSGADTDDSVVATLNLPTSCFEVNQAWVTSSGVVRAEVKNDCNIPATFPSGATVAVIVYDLFADSKT